MCTHVHVDVVQVEEEEEEEETHRSLQFNIERVQHIEIHGD